MLLKNVRLSFPSLFVATSFNADQAKKFGATFILDKGSPEHKKMLAEIERVAAERWGAKAMGTLQQLSAQNKVCLRDGVEKANMDGFGEGVVFFNASSQKRPGVYDRDQTPLTAEDGRPYAGCRVNAMVEVWCQDNQFGKRVNAELRGVQFSEDDEPFGGGGAPASADEFPKLEEREPGSDDDIPWTQGEEKATAGGWMD